MLTQRLSLLTLAVFAFWHYLLMSESSLWYYLVPAASHYRWDFYGILLYYNIQGECARNILTNIHFLWLFITVFTLFGFFLEKIVLTIFKVWIVLLPIYLAIIMMTNLYNVYLMWLIAVFGLWLLALKNVIGFNHKEASSLN